MLKKTIEINHGEKFNEIQKEVLNNTYNTMLWNKCNINFEIYDFNEIVEDNYVLESFYIKRSV